MIFIDTCAFLARHLARDQHHEAAIKRWARLAKSGRRCFTSNFVVDELVTLLSRRAGADFAAGRARAIYASGVLTVLRPNAEDELEALTFLEKYDDQKVSFTDCVSFALMRRAKVKTAFTFDRHFATAGFTLWS